MSKEKVKEAETQKRSISAEALRDKIAYHVRFRMHDMLSLAKLYERLIPGVRSCEWDMDKSLFFIEEGLPLTAEERKARWEARMNGRKGNARRPGGGDRRGRRWN